MSLLKRTLALCLAAVFCLIPLTSCAEEASNPTKNEETKTEESVKDETAEGSSLPEVLQGVEPDPLFYGQDPTEDEEFNMLMVGNSYSYYWLDELWGLLDAAGYENVRICDVYYSGCRFDQHWKWYVNGEGNYAFQIFGSTKRKTWADVGLEECMSYANWDYIGFQQSGTYMYGGGTEEGPAKFAESVYKDLPNLYRLMYQNFPQAQFLWVQHWVHEVGTSDEGGLKSQEAQDAYYQGYKDFAYEICPLYGFTNVPLGDAWQAIRHDPLFYEAGNGDYPIKTMHTRLYNSKFVSTEEITYDDLSHDGDIGGGQYLNACVWFEVLTHRSVVGNTFRPSYFHSQKNQTYTFTEEQIEKIQGAAHDAVVGCHSEAYYQ